MHALVRCAFAAVLVWQAAVATYGQVGAVAASDPGTSWRALSATGDERLHAALGDDAAVVTALRTLPVPDGALFVQRVTASLEELRRTATSERELVAAFERLSARNGLLVQLTTLLLPQPLLVAAADPVAAVEAGAAMGREYWLLVLAGDEPPRDRAGWTCTRTHPRYSTWRFRKAS